MLAWQASWQQQCRQGQTHIRVRRAGWLGRWQGDALPETSAVVHGPFILKRVIIGQSSLEMTRYTNLLSLSCIHSQNKAVPLENRSMRS